MVTDLGTLGANHSGASAVNERGQVIGWNGVHASFVWEKGRMRDLGSLGATSWERLCQAVAINERGQIIGLSKTKGGAYHPFLWQGGRMFDLAERGLAVAGTYEALNENERVVDINNRGQIVGTSFATGHPTRAFVWLRGKANYLGAGWGNAVAINERGQIIGWDTLRGRGTSRDLGGLSGSDQSYTHAVAINERGQIVGWSDTATIDAYGAAVPHAFLWQDGEIRDLGTLGGPESWASDINDRGQIVGNGYSLTSDGLQRVESRAFLWQDGRMTELATLGGTESEVSDINNRGQIVGWAMTEAGRKHAVLWTQRRGTGPPSWIRGALRAGATGLESATSGVTVPRHRSPVLSHWRSEGLNRGSDSPPLRSSGVQTGDVSGVAKPCETWAARIRGNGLR